MKIDWGKFSQRVTTGVRVRDQNVLGEIWREGILLETYPFCQDEKIRYDIDESINSIERQQIDNCASLRIQWFPQMHRPDNHLAHHYPHDMRTYNMPLVKYLTFLIDDQWITLEKILE